MMEEAVLASRDFITEGSSCPRSPPTPRSSPISRSRPPCSATSPRPPSRWRPRSCASGRTAIRLLATWQVGLGRRPPGPPTPRPGGPSAGRAGTATPTSGATSCATPSPRRLGGAPACRPGSGRDPRAVPRAGRGLRRRRHREVRVTGPDLEPIDVTLTRTGPRVHRADPVRRRDHAGRPGARRRTAPLTASATALATLSYAPSSSPGSPTRPPWPAGRGDRRAGEHRGHQAFDRGRPPGRAGAPTWRRGWCWRPA